MKRVWNNSDIIQLVFSMPIELIQSNPNVRENAGKLAIQRGPVVYCLEGIVVIRGIAQRSSDNNWGDILYRPIDSLLKPVTIKAIPYSMWANRTPGEMLVWIRMAL